MARTPQVTRTIKATKCVVLAVDTESKEVKEIEVIVPRTPKDEKLLQIAQEIHNTDTQKIVTVKSSEVFETLYGMSEDEFIRYAKPMPPRNVKEKE